MAFAQLIIVSLRDAEARPGAVGLKLCHMGLSSAVARFTLTDANASSDWRILADFAQVLIRTAIKLHARIRRASPKRVIYTRWIRPPSIFA